MGNYKHSKQERCKVFQRFLWSLLAGYCYIRLLWSVLAWIHPIAKHPHNVSHYSDYESQFDMNIVIYTDDVNKTDTFEKLNLNITVNVFACEEIYPLRITNYRGRKTHIDLLLLCNPNKTTRYCLIRNLSSVLSSLRNGRNVTDDHFTATIL